MALKTPSLFVSLTIVLLLRPVSLVTALAFDMALFLPLHLPAKKFSGDNWSEPLTG
jgi:hypothetical protein